MNKLRKLYLATVFAIAAAAAVTGCGGGGGSTAGAPGASTRSGSVKLTFKLPGGQAKTAGREANVIPSSTAKIAVMVTGDGLTEPEEQYVTDFTSDTASVVFSALPIGEKRFTIYAMDSSNNLLAASMEIVEVLDQKTIQLRSELGVIILDGAGALPSTIRLVAGDTLNVKNMRETQEYAMAVQGMDCPASGLSFGYNSQLACTFTQAGTYTLTAAGATLATVIVSAPAATVSTFKADASADAGYGEPPLSVNFSGRVANSDTTTSSAYTYSWDFGDGSSASTQNATHTYSTTGDYVAKLTVTSGSNTNTDYINFHVEETAAPTVTAVSPGTGANSASTPVSITGTGFQSGAAAQIGGSQAIDLTVVNSTLITATVPSGITAGVYDVTVTNPDGQTATLAGAFTVTGTAAVTYSIASYFPINAGDQRVYVGADSIEGNGFTASERTETVTGPFTVNGTSCYKIIQTRSTASGGGEDGACFSLDSTGLYLSQMISSDNVNGVSSSKTLTFSPRIKMTGATFGIGDVSSGQTTGTEVSSSGVTAAITVNYSFEILAQESVAVIAGYFPGAIKARFTISEASTGDSETAVLWFAPGVGQIKDVVTDSSSQTCATGCPSTLASATIGSVTYPHAVSTSAFSGNYWSAFAGVGTTKMSGYSTFAVSGSSISGSGVFGAFDIGSQTISFSDTYTLYSNGMFKLASSPSTRGIASYDGSAMAFVDPVERVVEYVVKKGSTYSSSMIQGSYFGTEIHYSASGTVRVQYTSLDISDATGTYTQYTSSSTGTLNQIATGTMSSISLSADGVMTSPSQANNLYLVGENGNIILKTRVSAGVRFLGVFVKKGTAMTSAQVSGPFMAINFGYEMGMTTPDFTLNGMALDVSQSGMMHSVDMEANGSYHFDSNSYSVSSDGSMYASNNPYLMIGAAGNGNTGVATDHDSLSITFLVRAVDPAATSALRAAYSRR